MLELINMIFQHLYLKIKKLLKIRCKSFIKECKKCDFNKDKLPNIEEYKEYVKKLSWYKDIYEKERLIVEKIENKRIAEYKLYHEDLEKLNKEKKI